jgi:hypothetical protein
VDRQTPGNGNTWLSEPSPVSAEEAGRGVNIIKNPFS